MGDRDALLALAERCEWETGGDNALDVLIEIALFDPDEEWVVIRANAAGTKIICTTPGGFECTFRARDWSMDRHATAAALRARAAESCGLVRKGVGE